MDIDVYRSLCENNNHEGSQVHHRNLGAADKIINNLANVHLIEKPALETAQSASSSIDDYSECFGLELADLYEEENEPALWKELSGVALDKYRERQGVELELAEDVTPSAMVFKGGVCVFHLYFKAKSNDHSSPVQIFAEVFRTKEGARHVSVCDIMDPSNPDLVRRCRYCVKKVLHPKGVEFFKFPSPEAYVRASGATS